MNEDKTISRKRKDPDTDDVDDTDDAGTALDTDTDVVVRAGKRSTFMTDQERRVMFFKPNTFLVEAMDEDRVVELPILGGLSENAWRFLFAPDPRWISHEETVAVYKASLYMDTTDGYGIRSLIADKFQHCISWNQFELLLDIWGIGVEQKATPAVVVPPVEEPIFPGQQHHKTELPLFHGQHFASLVARLGNVTLTQKSSPRFAPFYRSFCCARLETQVAFFNVFHAFAHRYCRNYNPFAMTQSTLHDLYQYLPYRDQIAYPAYTGASLSTQHSWSSRKCTTVAKYVSMAGETGPVPFSVFKDRFDRATLGFLNDPLLQAHFKDNKFCVVSGGMVATCLSSTYTDESVKGRDVDIFIGMRYRYKRDTFFERFYNWYRTAVGNRAFSLVRRGNVLEFICALADSVPKFQFILLDTYDADSTLTRFDIASRMVMYDGTTVRANYDGLQAWFTGDDVYDPVESSFRQTRFDKFRNSGFNLFAAPHHADKAERDLPTASRGGAPPAVPATTTQSSVLEDPMCRRDWFRLLDVTKQAARTRPIAAQDPLADYDWKGDSDLRRTRLYTIH